MISNSQQNTIQNTTDDFSSATSIEVPAVNSKPQIAPIQPTPYHYLSLLPSLIVAVTPLILGLTSRKRDYLSSSSKKTQARKQQDK